MALLERWRPSRELDRLRSELDDLMERFGFDRDWFGRFPLSRELFADWQAQPARPAIETRVEDDKFIVHADLPGIDPKDVDIKVVGDVLTIKARAKKSTRLKKLTTCGARSVTALSNGPLRCLTESKPKI